VLRERSRWCEDVLTYQALGNVARARAERSELPAASRQRRVHRRLALIDPPPPPPPA